MKQFLIFIGCVSVVTFLVYGVDKYNAEHHQWRISESYLLFFSIFGGAAGALAAMTVFRHKTRKNYFWIINLLSLVIHVTFFAVIKLGIF